MSSAVITRPGEEADFPEQDEVLAALRAMRRGDFSVRLPLGWHGVAGEIADAFNDIAANTEQLTSELKRVARAAGREGRLTFCGVHIDHDHACALPGKEHGSGPANARPRPGN